MFLFSTQAKVILCSIPVSVYKIRAAPGVLGDERRKNRSGAVLNSPGGLLFAEVLPGDGHEQDFFFSLSPKGALEFTFLFEAGLFVAADSGCVGGVDPEVNPAKVHGPEGMLQKRCDRIAAKTPPPLGRIEDVNLQLRFAAAPGDVIQLHLA